MSESIGPDAANRLIQMRRRAPLAWFRPSPALAPFLADPSRRICVRAANRVGKTRHAARKLAGHLVEHPGARGRWIGPARKQVQEVGGRYLSQFLEPYLSDGSYFIAGKGWNTSTIRLANGSTCQLRSYEDKPDVHAGDEFDMVIHDEPPPRAILQESLARVMSRRGQCIVVLTPVGRAVPFLREQVEAERSVWAQHVIPFSRENCPWYDEDQVTDWLETMRASSWQWAQRVEGAWEGYEIERMFTAFTDRAISDKQPAGRIRVGLGMDHGDRIGHEVAVLVAWRGSRIWVLDEWKSTTEASPEEFAREILALFHRNGVDPSEVDLAVGDTNAAGANYLGWSVNDVLADAMRKELNLATPPFRLVGADKSPGSVDWGMRCINYGLRRGDITVRPRCANGIQSLAAWKGGRKGLDGQLSHWADALRYITVAVLGTMPTYRKLRVA